MATIVDIARKAGVAPSTVSLVTNGNSRVSDATRERVQSVIKQLGYVPRKKNRREGGRHGGQFAVAYVTGEVQQDGMSTISRLYIEGLAKYLGQQDAALSLISVQEKLDEDAMLRTAFHVGQLDGLVLIGVDPSEPSNARFLASLTIPVVAINAPSPHLLFSAVCADYYQGTRDAVSHLIKHGHRQLGFVGLSRRHWPTRQRYRGMRDELREHGLPAAAVFMDHQWRAATDPEAVVRFCLEQVEQGTTALLVGDGNAEQVANALRDRLGCSVPTDVSIVGCDGHGISTKEGLQLATLDFDKRAMGEMTGQILLEMASPQPQLSKTTRVVPMHLVKGQTIAPPRQARHHTTEFSFSER